MEGSEYFMHSLVFIFKKASSLTRIWPRSIPNQIWNALGIPVSDADEEVPEPSPRKTKAKPGKKAVSFSALDLLEDEDEEPAERPDDEEEEEAEKGDKEEDDVQDGVCMCVCADSVFERAILSSASTVTECVATKMLNCIWPCWTFPQIQ